MIIHGVRHNFRQHQLFLTGVYFLIIFHLAQGYTIVDCERTSGKHIYKNSRWCEESFGNCFWSSPGVDDKVSLVNRNPGRMHGFALLSTTVQSYNADRFCLQFSNYISYHSRQLFTITVNDLKKVTVDTTTREELIRYCYSLPSDVYNILKFTLNASCVHLGLDSSYISNLSFSGVPTVMTSIPSFTTDSSPGEGTPAPIGDIQYVGVVVGAICIALFTLFSCLTIISARRSTTRESRRREIQTTCNEQDDRPDVVADNAPPSYDAVMACPDMYPATPQSTPPGTPDATPHLSLHRRALLNQLNSMPDSPQSQRHSLPPEIAEDWNDEQDPPPPYPGLARTTGLPVDTSGSSEDTNGPNGDTNTSDTGERTPVINTTENAPHINDTQSESAPTNDPDNGPWILNHTRNNPRGVNPRNLRQSGPGERNNQELVPRINRSSAERIDDIIDSDVQFNNSRNQMENSPKIENSVTAPSIPQLTVV